MRASRTEVAVTQESLTPDTAAAVLALAVLGEDADGIAPLSEQVLLRVRHASTRPTHLVARLRGAGAGTADGAGALVGYLVLQPGGGERAAELVAELVVHPAHRRHGIGRALLGAALDVVSANERQGTTLKIWAHGDRPEAAALAEHLGFVRDRILLQMRRPTST
ncbi:MAG: GNAT family N-acetyltransferase, partial [Actinomycetota bacterium]|nr:GNAT family N-acetyltransferase [Actinomycetota bacterium]